ncbi:MAG: hypothetical protein MUF36_12340 [Bacteroidales bacterium]|nr:hypothetical protein [Bacteroidales bacterium]
MATKAINEVKETSAFLIMFSKENLYSINKYFKILKMKKKSILIEALVILIGPIGGYIGY